MNMLNARELFVDFNNRIKAIKEPYRKECYFAFVYLCRGTTIYKMICAIDMGLPPLNAICKELESEVDCSNTFVRQMIGFEIKYVLWIFGYDIDNDKGRIALRKSCKGKYFKTGAFYKQVRKSKYTLNVTIEEVM